MEADYIELDSGKQTFPVNIGSNRTMSRILKSTLFLMLVIATAFGQGTKISGLPEITARASTDVLPVVSEGATSKVQDGRPTGAPDEFPGLELWLKADSLSLSDGAAVTTWTDSSGQAHHCTQSTSRNRPVFHTSVINRLPGVLFDHVDDYLNCGHALNSTVIGASGVKWTTFVVVKTLSNSTQTVWSKFNYKCTGGNCPDGAPDANTGRGPRFFLGKASDLDPTLFSGSKLLAGIVSDRKDGSTGLVYLAGADVASQTSIIVGEFDMTGASDTDKEKIWVNSESQTLTAQHAGLSGASDNLNSDFLIGADLMGINVALHPVNVLDAYLMELIVFRDISRDRRIAVNKYLSDKYGLMGVTSSSGAVYVRVYNSTAQAIPNATVTAVTFNSERSDTNNLHSTSSNTSRLTAGTPGWYSISGAVQFPANGTGLRQVYLRVNGSTLIAISKPGIGTASGNSLTINRQYLLAAGDYVELLVQQTSGGSLNVSADRASPEFTMVKIGP
jgi:hypothetical protein